MEATAIVAAVGVAFVGDLAGPAIIGSEILYGDHHHHGGHHHDGAGGIDVGGGGVDGGV